MTGSEFHDTREQIVAEHELVEQRGEIIADLATASGAASAALSKATLLYGPIDCGPAVNITLEDLDTEIRRALGALAMARRKADELANGKPPAWAGPQAEEEARVDAPQVQA